VTSDPLDPIEPLPVVAPPPPPPIVSYAAPAYTGPASGQSAYPPSYQSPYFGAPQPPKGLSIASMVLGIVGVFFSLGYGFGLLPSIAAVITGHLARKRQPYASSMSLAGLICGYIGIGISVLWIVGLIVFFSLIAGGAFGTSSSDFSNT
jgi:Domain of unknown function (DUF4190)